jgi:hypothetical protein
VLYEVAAFGVAAILGGLLGLLVTAIFYHPSTVRGAFQRIGQRIQVGTAGLMAVMLWASVAGLYRPPDQQGQPVLTTWGLAAEYTFGGAWLGFCRWRRSRSRAKPAGTAQRSSSNSTGVRRILGYGIRAVDYLLGALFVWYAYVAGRSGPPVGARSRAAVAGNSRTPRGAARPGPRRSGRLRLLPSGLSSGSGSTEPSVGS